MTSLSSPGGGTRAGTPSVSAHSWRLAGLDVHITSNDVNCAAQLTPWLDLFVGDDARGALHDPPAAPATEERLAAARAEAEPSRYDFTFEITVVPDGAIDFPPGPMRPLVEYLYVSGWTQGETLLFRGTDGSRLDIDVAARRALCRVPGSSVSGPPWVLRDLFNAAFTTFLRRQGRFPLHAAGIARDGKGLLIVGPPMAGKTSLSLNFLRRGWSWVADDKVVLERTPGGVIAGGLFRHSNIDPALVPYFPELEAIGRNEPLYPHSQKRGVDLRGIYGDIQISTTRPAWILFPRVVDLGPTRVMELDHREAFIEILCQMPLVNDVAAARAGSALLADLVRDTRAFRLEMGRDVLENPGRLPELAGEMGIPMSDRPDKALS